MLQANKAIRDNEVVNIYEMTVDDFNNVKRALEVLRMRYINVLLDDLIDYFHLQGDMKEV